MNEMVAAYEHEADWHDSEAVVLRRLRY